MSCTPRVVYNRCIMHISLTSDIKDFISLHTQPTTLVQIYISVALENHYAT